MKQFFVYSGGAGEAAKNEHQHGEEADQRGHTLTRDREEEF